VDSIPTSANQEDHNSMGSIAARKCFQILKNVHAVLAIEILTACQGLEFHKPMKYGKGTEIVYKEIRKSVSPLLNDRIIYKDIEAVKEMILKNNLLDEVLKKINLQ
jgi:histidine ammonia-lyase